MTTGQFRSAFKRACHRNAARPASRWATKAMAAVVITLTCSGDFASAQRFAAGGFRPAASFRPSMGSFRPVHPPMYAPARLRPSVQPRSSIGSYRPVSPSKYPLAAYRPAIPRGTTSDGPVRPGAPGSAVAVRPRGTTSDGAVPPVRTGGGSVLPPPPPVRTGGGSVLPVPPPANIAAGALSPGPAVGTVAAPVSPLPPISGPPTGVGRSPRGRGVPPAGERRYVPDEVLVELAGNPTDQVFNALAARHRLNRLDARRIGLTNSTWVRWRIPDQRAVPAVIRALAADNSIFSAQPNYVFALQQDNRAAAPNGGRADVPQNAQAGDSSQYALAKLHLPEAQALARGNRVVVAVIDTEIDKAHAELSGAITNSYDALGTAAPMESHGTGIAGTIAARATLLGAAPAVNILAIRAFAAGRATGYALMVGIDYAADHGARVINMSFAGPSDPALTRALARAHGQGRILIAAVGNEGSKSPPLFPAADPHVIAVTAVDSRNRLFEGANRGSHVAIAAPGVDILAPTPGNRYGMLTGTSFASAFVSGVAALLVERRPDLTPDAVKNILMSTAHALGPTGRDAQFGAGLMDAYQAMLSVDGRPAAQLGRGTGR